MELEASGGHLAVSVERTRLLSSRLREVADITKLGDDTWGRWTDPVSAQRMCDEIFSPQYEIDKKVLDASRDIHDRPVVYWRKMGLEALFKLLEAGEITAMDYHKETVGEEDKKSLHKFLADYDRHVNTEKGESYKSSDYERIEALSLAELASEVFEKSDAQKFERMFNEEPVKWNDLMNFLEKNVDPSYIKMRHAGGLMKRFSPFMSLAVASPRERDIDKHEVLVEFVLPDEVVDVNTMNYHVGEREVLAKKLKSQWIARIYIDTDTYSKDFVENPNTVVGSYSLNPKNEKLLILRGGAIEAFRWEVPLEETLPVSKV